MNHERWKLVEALFHQTLEAPLGKRELLLAQICDGDPEVQAEVLALLRADLAVEQLIARAPADSAGKFLLREPAAIDVDATNSWVGRSVGPFVLERIIGSGGMGVVYLGQRVGDMSQNVAIKVIARHLRGSPAVSQFLEERHALGRLEHPHIARLLDGGMQDGTPYIVMEYVDGRRLDEVCDDPVLAIAAKVELFLQLCGAVAFVHGHLILHRDLKPANVLVTDTGGIKLLDFGTLKRVDVEAADSLMTRAGMRSVTLRYASPEHLAGHPVSTATDVYSLGIILYRLLSGKLPDGVGGPNGINAAPLPALRATRQMRGDLEAIVAKALRYEAAERFSSVDAMAQDLRNALGIARCRRPLGTAGYAQQRS